MSTFTVWAPCPERVALVIGESDYPMTRSPGGWWSATVDVAGEVDYGFRLDGGPVRPDPRSRRQPGGVHARSRTFDAAGHRWADGGWTGRPLDGGVIYEVHLGTFTTGGTLDSAIDRLDDLADLGISFVEPMPVNAFNGPHNWGYDGVAWFAVHEAYGGPAAYQRFVDACHARGLGVIQDVVYNHLGPSGNYLPEFGPYLREDASNTWGAAVNLDGPGSDEVRRFILDNSRMWMADFHVDGLRLDAVHALRDTRAVPLLEELAVETDALADTLGRTLILIAESDLNDPRLFTPRAAGGEGLDASWNDDFHHAVHVAVTGETSGYYADFDSMAALAKVFTDGYFHDGSYSSFRGRHHGRPIDLGSTPAWRLVTFVQNHDQVGNRAAGDRLSAQAGRDAQAIAAVLLLTGPFTPMLFMGEEWAASTPFPFFTSHPEPELAARTRDGRLAEFVRHDWDSATVPDPQDPATFDAARLDWDERAEAGHAEMLALYRALLRLRESRTELTDPDLRHVRVSVDEDERWISIGRGRISVVANLSDAVRAIPVAADAETVLVATAEEPDRQADGRTVLVAPRSAAVLGPAESSRG